MNKELSLEGFRMPGEWESQKSVWIIWPYNKKDWPGLFDNIPEVVSKIISYLSINQNVNLLIRNLNPPKPNQKSSDLKLWTPLGLAI